MDRKQEYEALLQALEETPPALERTVPRARARLRRRRWGRRLGVPAAGLAGAFAAFAVLVNVSMPFAMACSGVPGLKELTAAVALSPSLKAAVEHDFVQYIGQSQTDHGITLELEYLMLDPMQMNFFLKITGPEEYDLYEVRAEFEDAAGEELTGYAGIMHSFSPGELTNAVSLHISDDSFRFPERLRMTCKVSGWSDTSECAPEETVGAGEGNLEETWSPQAIFTFEIPLDTSRFNDCLHLPAGDWVKVDGQRLRFSLDSYITHGRLNVEEHPDNTTSLRGLDFYLEDENGRRYENNPSSGVSALGTSYMCDSIYYDRPSEVRLCLRSVTWLEKEWEYVNIDLERGQALSPLPQGVEVRTFRSGSGSVELAFIAPLPPGNDETHIIMDQIGTMEYRTPQGEVRSTDSVSSMRIEQLWPGTPAQETIPEGHFVEKYHLDDYPWSTVEWKLHFTHHSVFPEPRCITLSG